MKEIRIHARAGQGAITTASLLGYAYFLKGMYPYAFPHFGAARMGAPMNAFVRVDSKPVRLRSQIYEPDYLIIVDPTLLRGYNCFSGLKEEGIALISGNEGTEVPKVGARQKAIVLPATEIAMKTIGRPLGNTGRFLRRDRRVRAGNAVRGHQEEIPRQDPGEQHRICPPGI
jgi:pyruvate ferredoxin oxidoreductase gamma subunit